MTEQQYGPWSAAVTEPERGRQLRSLASLAAVHLGSGHRLVAMLRRAESDDAALQQAHSEFETLPPLTRRRIISTFSAITWPVRRKTGAAP